MLRQVTHSDINIHMSTRVNTTRDVSVKGDLVLYFVNRSCGNWLSRIWHFVVVVQIFCVIFKTKMWFSSQYVDNTKLWHPSSAAPRWTRVNMTFILSDVFNWRNICRASAEVENATWFFWNEKLSMTWNCTVKDILHWYFMISKRGEVTFTVAKSTALEVLF